MQQYLRTRLSIMMFCQYFVHGATIPIFSLYLTGYLNFSGIQTGTILSMSAVAAFVSPLAGAFVADRRISAPRLYGLCHILGGVIMGVLSFQHRFEPFLLLYLTYMIVFGPTNALSNAVTFHHLPNSKQSFGGIRVWGTVGWIAVAWVFSFLWLRSGGVVVTSRLPDALKLSAISSILLGFYGFTIPMVKIEYKEKIRVFPIEAFRVMIKREVLLLSAVSFLVSFIDRYYYFGTAPFLRQIGFHEADIMPAMSLGQVPEVFAMVLLGFFIARLGSKRVLAIGVLMEVVRFAAFAVGAPVLLVLTGLSVHGIAYAFFFTTAFIYLDRHCDSASRSGVHQLFAIITSGFGSFLGSLVAGKTLDFFKIPETGRIDYQGFWMVPTLLAIFTFIAVILLFKKKPIMQKATF